MTECSLGSKRTANSTKTSTSAVDEAALRSHEVGIAVDVIGGIHPCGDSGHESFDLCISGASQSKFGDPIPLVSKEKIRLGINIRNLPDGFSCLRVGSLDVRDEIVCVVRVPMDRN